MDVERSKYDRIIVNTPMRNMGKEVLLLAGRGGLVFLEHDACQSYVKESKWYRIYPSVMKSMPGCRFVVSGRGLATGLARSGIDARFLPKAYERDLISYTPGERPYTLAFVGQTRSEVYKKRRAFLELAERKVGVLRMRAEFGKQYNNLLNQIRFFLSADIGFNEYMIKNFESMAAGCVLVAWRQPEEEQEALGFRDMSNVVLYSDVEELREKYELLRRDGALARTIAQNGREFAERHHSWAARVPELLTIIKEPLEKPRKLPVLSTIRLRRF